MTPGASTSPAEPLASSSSSAASTSRLFSPVEEEASSASTTASREEEAARSSRESVPLPPSGDVGSNLKHCGSCGQQLREPPPLPQTPQRVISVGSHAIVLPRPITSEGQTDQSQGSRTLDTLTDADGRPLCQACSEAFERISGSDMVPPQDSTAMDTDEASAGTSDQPGPPPPLLPPSSATTPASNWQAAEPVNPLLDTSQQASSSTLASSTMASPLSSSLPTLTSSTPLSISVAGGRRDCRLSATSPVFTPRALPPAQGYGSRDESQAASTSIRRIQPQTVDQGINPPPPVEAALDDDGFGPSSMTRSRLSTLPAFAHRSQSPSASRQMPSHLRAPYPDRHRRTEANSSRTTASNKAAPAVEPAIWFHPQRPDPMQDISRLRIPSKGRGCLYPGSIFSGTQKSGKLSYDVTVEILNIDLTKSHLDGYLNIRGLTEDWPELTTFFTAEVIGQDHSFHTGRWGASQADDDKHWQRFGAYKSLTKMLGQERWDGGSFNHMNKPFVFMRWKEAFLVPNHQVTDISGASFAGFYYVCAELGDMSEWQGGSIEPSASRFGPATSAAVGLSDLAMADGSAAEGPTSSTRRRLGSGNHSSDTPGRLGSSPLFPHHAHAASAWIQSSHHHHHHHQQQQDSSSTTEMPSQGSAANAIPLSVYAGTRRRRQWSGQPTTASPIASGRGAERSLQQTDPPINTQAATAKEESIAESGISGRITAFYYHENSEPYQQLDLRHVEKTSSETFELR